tara:strand:- start:59 stop:2821 length:2763 start_codon:yes stop_codon:yes gene_type:complete
MEKNIIFSIGLILIISFLSAGVFASFSYGDNNLFGEYSSGSYIQGTFNLSFSNQQVESVLKSNFDGTINILDFLNANGLGQGSGYNCLPSTCEEGYSSLESITSASIIEGEQTLVGFEIFGLDVSQVSSAYINITTSIDESCSQQIWIDILDDGANLVTNSKSSGGVCQQTYNGCFEGTSNSLVEATITTSNYCEKITLPPGPGYMLYSNIKRAGDDTDNAELSLSLYEWIEEEGNTNYLDECILPENSVSGTFEELSCEVNHSSAIQRDYLVCLRSDTEDTDYRINMEWDEPNCGKSGYDYGEFNKDYQIFAKQMEFEEIDFITLDYEDNSLEDFLGESFERHLGNYVSSRYGGDCEQGCVIPINIYGEDATLLFDDVEISWREGGGTLIHDYNLYGAETSPATFDTDLINLDLTKANFYIPFGSQDEEKFKLYLDDELIFEENINISESFDFEIIPEFAAYGQTVNFVIETSEEIIKSTWDFGDNSAEKIVNGKEIQYMYLEQGIFDVKVVAEKSGGVSATKTFSIVVGDPKEIANQTIKNYKSRIVGLKESIEIYPEWLKFKIKEFVNPEELSNVLDAIESNYENATLTAEYETVMRSLLTLEIPLEVASTENLYHIAMVIGYENLNPQYIEEISEETVENLGQLKENIGGWMTEFYEADVSSEKISLINEGSSSVLMTRFVINTAPIKPVKDSLGEDYNPYLILGYDIQNNGKFKSNYNQKEIGSGTFISLKNGQSNEEFEFVIYADYSIENLGAHISPKISRFGILELVSECNANGICEEGENKSNCDDCKNRWGWFTLWISAILFGFLIFYIVLQEWYKKYYEKTLFKNKNDFYNVLTFVNNSRKNGLTNSQIISKLRSSGWSGEKINYIMKRIDGKRTGLFEIPLFNLIGKKKIEKEIEKRGNAQGAQDLLNR